MSGAIHEACRNSTNSGSPASLPRSAARKDSLAAVRRNAHGNWASRPWYLPALFSGSSTARKSRNSCGSSVRSWVMAWFSFTTKWKPGGVFFSIRPSTSGCGMR